MRTGQEVGKDELLTTDLWFMGPTILPQDWSCNLSQTIRAQGHKQVWRPPPPVASRTIVWDPPAPLQVRWSKNLPRLAPPQLPSSSAADSMQGRQKSSSSSPLQRYLVGCRKSRQRDIKKQKDTEKLQRPREKVVWEEGCRGVWLRELMIRPLCHFGSGEWPQPNTIACLRVSNLLSSTFPTLALGN